MGEVQNEEQLEIMLPIRMESHDASKAITLDLIISNVDFHTVVFCPTNH